MDYKYTFSSDTDLEDRILEPLNFQMRILDIVEYDKTPIVEKVRFMDIIYRNLKEYFGVYIYEIKEPSNIFNIFNQMKDITNRMNLCILQLNKECKIELPVLEKPLIDILCPIIFKSVYSEETTEEQNEELYKYTNSLDSLYSIFINKKIHITNHNCIYNMELPENIMRISEYLKVYKEKFSKEIYPIQQDHSMIEWRDYLDKKKEMIFRCPDVSYDFVLSFIHQMCINKEIISIFITLYRVSTKSDAKIIESLICAAKNEKKVFVYIESHARNDEENNLKIANKLSKYKNIYISNSYFGYKVHAKMFLAIDKSYNYKYAHISTGNYNEITGNSYTDTHLITTKRSITKEITNMFTCLHEKIVYRAPTPNEDIYFSPSNIRLKLTLLFHEEIKKKSEGEIWIKCNNLCDDEMTSLIEEARRAGVKIWIICRSYCTIKPSANVRIRSKIGQYLEHDRYYVFGKKAYIASADLLFRNLSKRVETMCEADYYVITNYFSRVWFQTPIHEMKSDGSWELLK